jgi:hypothetical protein
MPDSAIGPTMEQDALVAALPRLRRIQMIGWAAIAAVLAVVVLALAADGVASPGRSVASLLAALAAPFVAVAVIGYAVQRRHGSEIMPIVAGAFGLTHDRVGRQFLQIVPKRIPPRSTLNRVTDHLTGEIAGRTWHAAFVRTKTRRQHTPIQFEGLVQHIASAGPLPPLLACRVQDTQDSTWLGRAPIDVSGLAPVPLPPGALPEGFGIWRTEGTTGPDGEDPDRIITLIDAILRAASGPYPDARFVAVLLQDRAVTVATSHVRDSFRIGGLPATRTSVLRDIRRVAQEVAPMIRTVTDILQAEAAIPHYDRHHTLTEA